MAESGHQRLVNFVVTFLSRRGESGKRSAVKRPVCRHDNGTVLPAAIVMFAYEFYCALVSLRAAVGQKHLGKNRAFKHFFAQDGLFFVVKKVGRVDKSARLTGNRRRKFGVVVTEAVYTYPRNEIYVFFSGRIVKSITLTVRKTQVLPTEYVHVVAAR